MVAPLNWGLGHATRCIPVIRAIIEKGWEPVVASDGDALHLLQQEFPLLKTIDLPSYQISYPSNQNLRWHLLKQLPKIVKTMCAEHYVVQEIIQKEQIDGIISDNRLGVWSKEIPSVYITHQLTVLSGITTFFTSFMHQKMIKKFDECWIPDTIAHRLSGNLATQRYLKIKSKHLGVVSRLYLQPETKKFDICVLLSGPEPQRTILEKILFKELKRYKGNVCFIRGVISNMDDLKTELPFTFYQYVPTKDLNKILNQSDLIIARSGYSTILDLAALGKRAFLIPTPGQTEQEYLAAYLQQQKIAPFCEQENFKLQKLEEIKNYTGFTAQKNVLNDDLWEVFG